MKIKATATVGKGSGNPEKSARRQMNADLSSDALATGSAGVKTSVGITSLAGAQLRQVEPRKSTVKVSAIADLGFIATAEDGTIIEGSRQGDEDALEALAQSTSGLAGTYQGWSISGMSLSNNIYGVTTASINGELRVTELDISNSGIGGSIDVPEIANLTELILFDCCYNNLVTAFPSGITNCTNLRYLYMCRSDYLQSKTEKPHVESNPPFYFTLHPGKHKGTENNHIFGAIPDSIDNLQSLEWFFLEWTSSGGGDNEDGINYVPSTIWNLSSVIYLRLYANTAIGPAGNILDMPANMSQMANLRNLAMGGFARQHWDPPRHGWVRGDYPLDMDQIPMETLLMHGSPQLAGFPQVHLPNINDLWINFNDFSDGALPEWLFDGGAPDLIQLNTGHSDPPPFGVFPNPCNNPGLNAFGAFNNSGNPGYTGPLPTTMMQTAGSRFKWGDFYGNSFDGWQTQNMTNVTGPRWLNFRANRIRGQIPYLDWGAVGWTGNSHFVDFRDNKLNFQDFLWVPPNSSQPCIDKWKQFANVDIRVSPQDSIGSTLAFNEVSGIIDFSEAFEHSNNSYQWQRNGVNVNTNEADPRMIDTNDFGDGTYELVVTNSMLPELTLRTIEINTLA